MDLPAPGAQRGLVPEGVTLPTSCPSSAPPWEAEKEPLIELAHSWPLFPHLGNGNGEVGITHRVPGSSQCSGG